MRARECFFATEARSRGVVECKSTNPTFFELILSDDEGEPAALPPYLSVSVVTNHTRTPARTVN